MTESRAALEVNYKNMVYMQRNSFSGELCLGAPTKWLNVQNAQDFLGAGS